MSRELNQSFLNPRAVDRRFAAVALVLVVLLTIARVVSLIFSKTDLYVDESQYWSWAQELDWGYYSKPPLIAVIIAATTGLFGDAEWAVRLGSPLFHCATAFVLCGVGNRLYGGRVGGIAALTYATIPAVALSSTLISTDAPLLFFWSLALWFLLRLLERDDWRSALFYGLAIAIGVNAKYAMLFLPPLAIIAVALVPAVRFRLASPRLWVGTLIAFAGLIPNLIWNAQNGWATLRHTGDNANWTGSLFHPMEVAEFLGAQFGVFGPILLILLILAALRRLVTGNRPADRMLLTLSLPIIAIFTVQALLSRANANWAATAYPAATVLVSALLEHWSRQRLRRLSLALHSFVAAALIVGPVYAPSLSYNDYQNPFQRILGIQSSMQAILKAAGPVRTLVFTRRADVAAALYYFRDEPVEIRMFLPENTLPKDHFQLTRPLKTTAAKPGVFVAADDSAPPMRANGPTIRVEVAPSVSKSGEIFLTPVVW